MKLAESRFEPSVQLPFQNAPLVGVGAVELERTGIAGAGGRAVGSDAAPMIGVQLDQLVTRGAVPIVEFTKIDESGGTVALGPPLRTARQTLQEEGYADQEEHIGRPWIPRRAGREFP